jgi:hypothetical protein
MVPSRVDPNKKQAKSLIDQVEDDTIYLDRMARSVNFFPNQATVDNVKKTPRVYFMNVLMMEKRSKFKFQQYYI